MSELGIAVGDRIRLLAMSDDPNPILPGEEGTVWAVPTETADARFYEGQIGVSWDSGRRLFLLIGKDVWEKIDG